MAIYHSMVPSPWVHDAPRVAFPITSPLWAGSGWEIFKVVGLPWCLSQNGAPGTTFISDQLVTYNMNVYFNKSKSLSTPSNHPCFKHAAESDAMVLWLYTTVWYHHPGCMMHPGWHSPSPPMTQLSQMKSLRMKYPM